MQVPGSSIRFVLDDRLVLIIYFRFDFFCFVLIILDLINGWMCHYLGIFCTSFSEEVEDVGLFFFFQKSRGQWGAKFGNH